MSQAPEPPPLAVILFVVGDRPVEVGRLAAATRCDLALVEQLLQLRLSAARLGCTVLLADVRCDLRALVELVGVTDWLVE